jgi:hypothetical protein
MAPLLIDKEGVSIIIHGREHLPPHIHASYGDYEALIDIRTGIMFEGQMPGKKLKVVQNWLSEGKNGAVVEENFYELNPRLKLEAIAKPTQAGKTKRRQKK